MFLNVEMPHDYPGKTEIEDAIKKFITRGVEDINSKDISKAYNNYLNRIMLLKVCSEFSPIEETSMDIFHNELTLDKYIQSGVEEMVQRMKEYRINDMALFRLVTEGHLMPIENRNNNPTKCIFHLKCIGFDGYIKVYIDRYVFNKFIVIPK